MERRDFVKLCAAAAGGASLPGPAEAASLSARMYKRATLVDDKGAPIRLGTLKVGQNYVFDYPYSSTPCFLLRLDRPAAGGIDLRTESGQPYRWEGGIGESKAVVAYSAICAHKMTYPTRQVSFIGYRDGPSPVAGKGKVITCCSDRSSCSGSSACWCHWRCSFRMQYSRWSWPRSFCSGSWCSSSRLTRSACARQSRPIACWAG